MFRRSLFVAGLGVAALLATASIAVAHGGGGPRGPMRGLVRSLQSVELTEAQQTELDELVASLPTRERGERGERPDHAKRGTPPTPEEREARRATRQAHKALVLEQLASETPDGAALHAMMDDGPRGEAPSEAHDVLDKVLAFHATLSAEQRAAWVASLEQAMEQRGRRGHGHRRHRRVGDVSTEG